MTTTKAVSIDEETGREYYTLSNGATMWKDNGHFRTGPTLSPIAADPRGNLAKRNEKSRQIAREAIDEAAGLDPSKWGTGEGWRRVIVHTAKTYLESKNIRGMGEVLTKLAMVSGYMTREEAEKGASIHIENLNVGMAQLVADILAAKGQQATDATIIDATLELVEAIENDRRNNLPNLAEPG